MPDFRPHTHSTAGHCVVSVVPTLDDRPVGHVHSDLAPHNLGHTWPWRVNQAARADQKPLLRGDPALMLQETLGYRVSAALPYND